MSRLVVDPKDPRWGSILPHPENCHHKPDESKDWWVGMVYLSKFGEGEFCRVTKKHPSGMGVTYEFITPRGGRDAF